MDSKVVNKEIKRVAWKKLKEFGFSHFTPRVAWRYFPDRIEILEFRSFNKYKADGSNATTFSFEVELGVHLLYVPSGNSIKIKNGILLPSIAECKFRGSIEPSLQFQSKKDPYIWSIDQEGSNISACVEDVVLKLPLIHEWFSQFEHRENVFNILLNGTERLHKLFGFGRNPSPIRSYLLGYVALSIGNRALAEEKLQEAVESQCFTYHFASLEEALSKAL
ncbi:hypothetical protein CBP51_05635 [Cellvibrio mixtus]|uniref:DUF4304 domain-containing protein n=1 Tax=Cellvibrio mixtus TaxID=39650 RepID=A0A266Q9I4_9GAMM|nr:hypothetical protein [Cellvibrio mixtus]OZY86505.1 hypothetical protein CBP51_05635 [Cellvibrio mixtus]